MLNTLVEMANTMTIEGLITCGIGSVLWIYGIVDTISRPNEPYER